MVGAAGDGAGGDQSEADAVNLISAWNPNLFLYLGDVYEKGTTTEFDNWYRPSNFYGRFRSITNPTIGNHEYENGQAPGLLRLLGQRPAPSASTHGWHLISLDTNNAFNQTAPGTARVPVAGRAISRPTRSRARWSTTTSRSTTSARKAHRRISPDLVAAGAAQRRPRRERPRSLPAVAAARRRGEPEPDGRDRDRCRHGRPRGRLVHHQRQPRRRVGDEFGALRLDLNSGGATFQFANTQGQVRDSGSVSCDSSRADTTPPSDPTGLTATATYKTNIDLSWSASSDNVGVTGYKIYRDGAYLTTVHRNSPTRTAESSRARRTATR